MSDEQQAIALLHRTGSEALSLDQVLLLHQTGQLRPPPGQGVQVQVIGSVPGYSDEVAEFHPEIASVLVQRGAAVYL